MANGQVTTGFSKPYVAAYSASGTTVTYSSPQPLARGVDVSMEVESSEDNKFYADNQAAESAPVIFTGGELAVTVDGLKTAAEKAIYGLPTAGTDGWTAYGDQANPPYMGFGCIRRVQSEGVVSFQPIILTKVKFNYSAEAAATQEESIDWQTQELTAQIFRDDTANHNWKAKGALFSVGTTYTTEALAEAAAESALVTKLGGTTSGGGSTGGGGGST